jgi:nucleoside-diphosphate kinase
MAIERTLILVKPDGVRRGLVGEVLGRLERKGLRLVALELRTLAAEVAEQHYAEHQGKPFYDGLIEFITSGPLVALVVEGESAIRASRVLMGATNPTEAAPGSIRGDLATETSENIVHGSDSPESAAREIALFFPALA